MNKSDRIAAFVDSLATGGDPAALAAADGADRASHPCYLGYFQLFNEGRYYEAHDVLEHLWLGVRGDPDFLFFKGLIQVAGAFVHLQKQHDFPAHAKHGRRLRPAARLFALAEGNLSRFPARHLGLDVAALRALCADTAGALAAAGFTRNPWSPATAPRLVLLRSPAGGGGEIAGCASRRVVE